MIHTLPVKITFSECKHQSMEEYTVCMQVALKVFKSEKLFSVLEWHIIDHVFKSYMCKMLYITEYYY